MQILCFFFFAVGVAHAALSSAAFSLQMCLGFIRSPGALFPIEWALPE